MDSNIDIDNFELPEFESSKYVLTSPRSLKACEILNIKVNISFSRSRLDLYLY